MPQHKQIGRKKKPSGAERMNFVQKSSPPSGRAASSRNPMLAVHTALLAALSAMLAALAGLLLTTLMLLTGLALPALLRIALLVLRVALRILLFVRHWDALHPFCSDATITRNFRGGSYLLRSDFRQRIGKSRENAISAVR